MPGKVKMDDFPCNPMDGGCKALERVRGELTNEKASKNYVDGRLKTVEQKIDKLTSVAIGALVTFSLTAVFAIARFALALLTATR